jgi:hypothetical protein
MSGTQGRAMIDKLLTNVSQKLVVGSCVADLLLPELNVKQQSGKLGKYGKDHLRIVNTVMGGKGKARRVETVTRLSDSYYIEGHGLEDVVTPEDYRNVEQPFDAESDATEGLMSVLQVEKEFGLASALTDTAVMTQNTTLVGQSQFSDFLNSDPVDVVNTAKLAIRAAVGAVSDLVMVMDWAVANKLQFHPAILQALGFAQNRAGQLSYDELAKVFGVKRILVPDAVYLSSKEGQTDVVAPIWGKHIVLAQCPEKAAKMQMSLGYRVQYAGQGSRKVYKYPINNPPESNAILVKDDYDQLIVEVGAGYLIKNAIA